ncbi:maleylacetate reductase [Aliamphritea spongicola]|nr:maleylacetate reductase [Aliamphritea spongicola]
MHVPAETAKAAIEAAKNMNAGCTIAVGGGSTIGLAKAIALDTGKPILAVPTTYAGSEMTPIWGITEAGVKTTGRDLKVLPRTVIYDPELLVTLPDFITGPSGMNAIAHCVEALYAENANPITSMMAEEGIRAIGRSLEEAVKQQENIAARSDTLGAWLAGASLGAVGMALHHKLCHTLGGSFNLPHAEVHTIIIPYVTAYNTLAAPDAIGRVAKALGVESSADAASALFDLNIAIGAKMTLSELGMTEEDLDKAADIATRNPYYNPQPVTRESIRRLLDDAFHGRRPTVD